MVLPPQHRHPGKKYRYNLIIIGLDGLSTPANKTNTELVIGETFSMLYTCDVSFWDINAKNPETLLSTSVTRWELFRHYNNFELYPGNTILLFNATTFND